MKQLYLLVAFAFIFIKCAFAQGVCEPNGVSTLPTNPQNPLAPSPFWLNQFQWYDEYGLTLYQYALHDMFGANEQGYMLNPMDLSNGYPELTSENVSTLDYYPEDGWELLSINLGSYPNGQILSTINPPVLTGFPETPYIIFYNKRRGIIRLFANSLTGLSNSTFDSVLIELGVLESPNSDLSGIMRHNGGYDQALDKPTFVKYAQTLVRHPNNPTHWFYADFQMGFDPCTCIYNSKLAIKLIFLENSEIKMTSRGIYAEIDLIDANEHSAVPVDFLAGVQYKEGYSQSGIVIYHTMEKMIDDYLKRLDAVELHNEGIGENMSTIKKKKAVLYVLKFVLNTGLDVIVTQELSDNVKNFAAHIIKEIGIDGEVKIDKAKLKSESKKILGKGFDWLSKEWIDEPTGKLATPKKPTATISETTFDGVINTTTIISGPTLLAPGTHPVGAGGIYIGPNSYPVYNEVLGLFALLNTPKVLFSEELAIVPLFSEWTYGDPSFRTISEKRTKQFRFKLNDPLEFVFNPAAGIDMSRVNVEASLVVKYISQAHNPVPVWSANAVPTGEGTMTSPWQKKPVPSEFARSAELDNFEAEELYSNTPNLPLTSTDIWSFGTPFLPVDNFNELVASFAIINTEKWSVRTGLINPPIDAEFVFNYIVSDRDVDLSDLTIELKLMVTMPFTTSGSNGQMQETTQLFTYLLDPYTDMIVASPNESDLISTWSLTASPSGGSIPLTDNLVLQEKHWSLDDAEDWGLTADNIIKIYATDNIVILGNQTHSEEIEKVEFIAVNDLFVQQDATLSGNFHLYIDDFVNMQSSPTPTITNSYLNNYCQPNETGGYEANIGTRTAIETSAVTFPTQQPLYGSPVFSTFPNPADQFLTIQFVDVSSSWSAYIYNSVGQLITDFQVNFGETGSEGTLTIQTGSLAQGMYFFVSEVKGIRRTQSFSVHRR